MASAADRVEAFLASRPFERGPWVAVAFAAGIGAWFVLPDVGRWLAWLAGFAGLAFAGPAAFGREGRHPLIRIAVVATALMLAAEMATVWTKSALVGAKALERPQVTTLTGRIVEREEQGAEDRVRLTPIARGIEGRETARVSSRARCSRPAGASTSWSATGGCRGTAARGD